MQLLANSRLRPGVTRERFIEYIKRGIAPESWELVQKGVIQQWLWKPGDAPGLVVFLNCASLEEARALAGAAPIVTDGIVEFEIDPVDLFPSAFD